MPALRASTTSAFRRARPGSTAITTINTQRCSRVSPCITDLRIASQSTSSDRTDVFEIIKQNISSHQKHWMGCNHNNSGYNCIGRYSHSGYLKYTPDYANPHLMTWRDYKWKVELFSKLPWILWVVNFVKPMIILYIIFASV